MATVAPLQLQQQQLILRLPDELAARVHVLVNEGQQIGKGKPATVIDVKPQDPNVPSDDFVFVVDNKEYPALLLNLPTPLESHKTFDNKIFLKSSDIGQMLQVFNNVKERDTARLRVVKTLYGDYHSSGITPPTNDVVKRRFELTRKNETYLPYKIKQVCEEISQGVDSVVGGGVIFNETPSAHVAAGGGGETRRSHDPADETSASSSVAVLESVVEEVVDFEEWMADPSRPGCGVSITVSGADWTTRDAQFLQMHPEMMLTQVEAEEDALEQLAAEQQLTEKDRLAQAVAMLGGADHEEPKTVISEPSPADGNITDMGTDDLRISLKLTPASFEAGSDKNVLSTSSNQSPRSNADEDLEMTLDDEEEDREHLEAQPPEEDEEEEEEDEETHRPQTVSTETTVEAIVEEQDKCDDSNVIMSTEVANDDDDDDDWMNSI